jgi:hypothetical protein
LRQEIDGPGLVALLERLASPHQAGHEGLLADLRRQPRLGARTTLLARRSRRRLPRPAGLASCSRWPSRGWRRGSAIPSAGMTRFASR